MAMPMYNVEVKTRLTQKGRGLFAVCDFEKDDTLFEEKPLICSQFSWNTLYKYTACDHCMKSLEKSEEMSRRLCNNPALVIPYPECCTVATSQHTVCPHCQTTYCSETCKSIAWQQYHKTLCMGPSADDKDHPLNKLQDVWRNMHYPPETATVMLLARMIATVKQAANKELVKEKFSDFCKTSINDEEQIAHKLLGPEFQVQLDLLRNILAEYLYEESIDEWFTPDGFKSVFALIGRNGQGIGSSSISAWVSNCEKLVISEQEKKQLDIFIDQLYEDLDKVSGTFLNCEGSGLYSLQSKCNHSCSPNAEVTFPHNNSTVVVKALQDIYAGEEITISYLDDCNRERSRHSRQKLLRENYLFVCDCPLCESQKSEPDVTSSEDEEDSGKEEDMEHDI